MAAGLVGTIGVVSLGATGAAVTPAWGTSETRAAGNLLVCWCDGHGVATLPTTPSGWSVAAQVAGTSCSTTIYYRVATGADAAPTIAGVTSNFWQVQLAEFSGVLGTAPRDQFSAGTSTLTSPSVATAGAANAANELSLVGFAAFYSVAAVKTITPTFNNGTYTTSNNDATSLARHYKFGYVLTTTAHAAADSDSMAFTTTQVTGTAHVVVSFQLAAANPGPVARVSLASATSPPRTGHELHVRARIQTGAAATIRMALYEGATNRSGDLESAALTTSLAEYTLPISDVSAATITSYSDLEVRFWGYSANGGAPVIEVADVWLVTPQPGPVSLPRTASDSWSVSDSVGGALSPSFQTLIDDFTRADGPIDTGAGAAIWTRAMVDGTAISPDLRVYSNTLGSGAGAVWRSSYTNRLIDNSGGNCDIVIDCVTAPVAPNNEFGLWCLITDPGTTVYDGYIVYFSGGTWILRRILNGVSQGNLTTAAGTLSAGDTIWFQKRGSALKVFKRPAGGGFTQILSATDANHNPASGVVGIEISDSTQRWDNLLAGPLVALAGLTASDSWTVTDSVLGDAGLAGRTATDSWSVGDSATRAVGYVRPASDSWSVSDSALRSAATRARTASDAVAVSDSAGRAAGLVRPAVDSWTVSDGAVRAPAARVRAAVDSWSVSDAGAVVQGRVRPAADSWSVSDLAVRAAAARVRAAADSVAVSDFAARAVAVPRVAVDSWAVSDGATQARAVAVSASDSWTVGDAATRKLSLGRPATDSWTVSDQVVRAAASRLRTASDAVAVSDTAAGVLTGGAIRNAADSWTVSDAATRASASRVRTAADSWTVNDAVAAAKSAIRVAADSFVVADAAAALKVTIRTAADTVLVSDAALRGPFVRVRVASDIVTFADVAVRGAPTSQRGALDTWPVSDLATTRITLARGAADSITLSDVAVRYALISRGAFDSFTVSDSAIGGAISILTPRMMMFL